MKQRITIDQLQQLTPSQQDKLREWWKPETYDIFSNGNLIATVDSVDDEFVLTIEEDLGSYKEDILPLLSIGQMIQFIDEAGGYFRYQFIVGRSRNAKSPDEFCDSLWEGVKRIL